MYLKFTPSQYVLRYANGKLVKEGSGLAFFCIAKNTAVVAVPMANIAADYFFEQRTKDFQTVNVQGQLTYRVADFKRIAQAMNFTVGIPSKQYVDDPINKLNKRMINIAGVSIKEFLAVSDLTEALAEQKGLEQKVSEQLRTLPELKQLGIEVIGFSILAVTPTKETVRALESKTREAVLKQADDALYERRNASIEQERKVKENELNTAISVEEKQKKIKESEIATKKMVIEKENEFALLKARNDIECEQLKIEAEIELEKNRRELAALQLENAKKQADAEAYRITAVMQAYNTLNKDVLVALATLNMEPEKMIAKAFENLAASSEKIGSLNISPELLESLKMNR